jgi:hypothetical protein
MPKNATKETKRILRSQNRDEQASEKGSTAPVILDF